MSDVIAFIKALIALSSVAQEIVDLVNSGVTWAQVQIAIKNFKMAEQIAHDTKDTTDLENRFRNP